MSASLRGSTARMPDQDPGKGNLGVMQIALLIGAAEYPIAETEARRLESAIREECADLHGQPHDENARACLQLADVIREDLERGSSPEPVELGMSHVEGPCEYVIKEEGIPDVALLKDLCDALRRYRAG
jgi:hypothetical protein